jgi:hypothetical protein
MWGVDAGRSPPTKAYARIVENFAMFRALQRYGDLYASLASSHGWFRPGSTDESPSNATADMAAFS